MTLNNNFREWQGLAGALPNLGCAGMLFISTKGMRQKSCNVGTMTVWDLYDRLRDRFDFIDGEDFWIHDYDHWLKQTFPMRVRICRLRQRR